MKIKNILFANKTVGISTEDVIFDDQGIGDIKSDKIYNQVLKLQGFYPVVEEKKVVEKPIEVAEEKKEPIQEEKKVTKPVKPTVKTTNKPNSTSK